jgi:hypothetical protein
MVDLWDDIMRLGSKRFKSAHPREVAAGCGVEESSKLRGHRPRAASQIRKRIEGKRKIDRALCHRQ